MTLKKKAVMMPTPLPAHQPIEPPIVARTVMSSFFTSSLPYDRLTLKGDASDGRCAELGLADRVIDLHTRPER